MRTSRRYTSARRVAAARGRSSRALARQKAAALRAWLSRVAAATGRPGDGDSGEAQGVGETPTPRPGRDARALPRNSRRAQSRSLRAALLRTFFRNQPSASGPSGAKPQSPTQTKGDR